MKLFQKKICIALCLLLCLGMTTILNVDAKKKYISSENTPSYGDSNGIIPTHDYTDDIYLSLSFNRSIANCSLMIIGYPTSTGVKANMWLYEKNDDGSWTLLEGWRNMTSNTYSFGAYKNYTSVSKGETYKLYFTGKMYGPNGLYYDPLTAETIITYEYGQPIQQKR